MEKVILKDLPESAIPLEKARRYNSDVDINDIVPGQAIDLKKALVDGIVPQSSEAAGYQFNQLEDVDSVGASPKDMFQQISQVEGVNASRAKRSNSSASETSENQS